MTPLIGFNNSDKNTFNRCIKINKSFRIKISKKLTKKVSLRLMNYELVIEIDDYSG